MLTSDLIQVRLRDKCVYPRYIDDDDPDHLALASQLIDTFAEHDGARRADLDATLQEILGSGTDFQLHRALAKLLTDRCEFDTVAAAEPEALRAAVFEAAAAAYGAGGPSPADDMSEGENDEDGDGEEQARARFVFDRSQVLVQAAQRAQVEPAEIEAGLYADLKDQQVLVNWRPCKPQWLLRRYNVALAQGVLYRALELVIEVERQRPVRQRALFRKIKFFQLMHSVSRLENGGYRIVLDGPLSLFQASGKYGLQMASFLPTLLHFDGWSLGAKLRWGPKRRPMRFELAADDGLRSHTRLTGQWQPEELTWLPKQLAKLETGWTAKVGSRLINLGGEGVLVPDYELMHADSGTRIAMEVFGYWNRGALESRLELLRRHGPPNVVLALSSQLASGREDLASLADNVYVFRTHPIARKLVKILRRFEA